MIKLKNMLKEGYVWDRKFGESLPKIQIPTESVNEEVDNFLCKLYLLVRCNIY